MAVTKKHLYRSVRKDEFSNGVLTEDGKAMQGILHGDIDPRKLTSGKR